MDVTILDWMRILMDAMLNIYLTMDPHGLLSTCFYTVLRKFGRETACAPPLTLTFDKFGAVKVAAIIVSKKSTQCWTLHFCSLSSLSSLSWLSCSAMSYILNQVDKYLVSSHSVPIRPYGLRHKIAQLPWTLWIANLGVYVCPFVCTQLVAVAALPLCSWSWGDFQSIVRFAGPKSRVEIGTSLLSLLLCICFASFFSAATVFAAKECFALTFALSCEGSRAHTLFAWALDRMLQSKHRKSHGLANHLRNATCQTH